MEKILNDGDVVQPDYVDTQEKKTNARRLEVLVDLIKKDLADAELAGMEYYKAAGEKLIEAKTHLTHGSFGLWVENNFGLSRSATSRYMRYADPNVSHGKHFKSQREFREEVLHEKRPRKTQAAKPDKPKPDIEAFNKQVASDKEERELQRKLALKLIDIGYHVLAKELHPDAGGDGPAAMQRLNTVRDRLKACAD